jgi:hypothetical protein
MTAIFAFDEIDEHLPRTRRDTASSVNSFDDRWFHNTQTEDFDVHSRIRNFGPPAWNHTAIAEEEETPLRVGTPPIPIPYSSKMSQEYAGSVQVDFDEDFVASQVNSEGPLNRKMVPSDFEQVRVLGKGGYGTVLLVRHKESGQLFAQKQLKKASLVVQTKIVGSVPFFNSNSY